LPEPTPPPAALLRRVAGLVLDVDGTLALADAGLSGYEALPGAVELLERLQAARLPYLAFTNGTAKSPRDCARALRAAGLRVSDEQMLTPVSVAVDVLACRRVKRVLVFGIEAAWQPLRDAGIEVVCTPQRADDADAVVIGWHTRFELADLDAACRAVWGGAAMYTVSVPGFFATRAGRQLGLSGAVAAAVRSVTGRGAVNLGKPSRQAMRLAGERLGCAPSALAVVGDDPALEVDMALRNGAVAIGVHTGITDAAGFAARPHARRPHLSLSGVSELIGLWPWPADRAVAPG
jgi:4-nitrophenyl phosphatase